MSINGLIDRKSRLDDDISVEWANIVGKGGQTTLLVDEKSQSKPEEDS